MGLHYCQEKGARGIVVKKKTQHTHTECKVMSSELDYLQDEEVLLTWCAVSIHFLCVHQKLPEMITQNLKWQKCINWSLNAKTLRTLKGDDNHRPICMMSTRKCDSPQGKNCTSAKMHWHKRPLHATSSSMQLIYSHHILHYFQPHQLGYHDKLRIGLPYASTINKANWEKKAGD